MLRKYKTALLLSTIPLLITVYGIFLAPRPAGVMQTDIEPDFYYNARLLNETGITPKIIHPGTPIQLLFSFLVGATHDPVTDSDAVRIALYLLIGLANSAALFYFLMRIARNFSFGVQLLMTASIIAWPPFLTHLGYAGSDSFLFAAALPAAALLCAPLFENRPVPVQHTFLSGAWTGLMIAIKITALPFAALLAVGAILLRARPITFALAALLSFIASTFPFAAAYPFFLKDNVWNQLHSPPLWAGVELRYFSPLIIVVPLAIAWCVFTFPHLSRFLQRWITSCVVAALACALVVFSVESVFSARAEIIAQSKKHTAMITERIQHTLPPNGTFAYSFVGSPYAPASAFHFWGNYIYANNLFDEGVLRAFPHETLFQIQTARRLLTAPSEPRPRTRSLSSSLEQMRAQFMLQNPLPYPKPTGLLFAGETRGVKPDLIIFPLSGENVWADDEHEELQELISVRTGAPTVWKTEIIDGVPYAFISLTYRNPK